MSCSGVEMMKINKLSKRKLVDYGWGYLMIAPVTLGLGVFYFYPFFQVMIDSFYNVGAFGKRDWAGLANYKKMLSDTLMWSTMANTFKYVLIIVPFTIIISLIVAVLLNTNIKGRSVFRVIYFMPAITMATAVAMVWRWIYNGDFGILNYVVSLFGGEAHRWLSDKATALLCISSVSIWMGVGFNMIILLAGIQGISRSYYEAAEIDGATGIQKFKGITLPLVTPTLFYVMTTTIISTFQTFDIIYMMIDTKSQAMKYTGSVVSYFYRNAFVFSKKGYASAIAVLLFLIIMLVTAIQMKMQKRWVNYD